MQKRNAKSVKKKPSSTSSSRSVRKKTSASDGDQTRTGLPADLLNDPNAIDRDLEITAETLPAGHRWGDLTECMKRQIVSRLMSIVCKRHITVTTRDGPHDDEVIADKNAIAASRVLAMMEARNQKGEHDNGADAFRRKANSGDRAAQNNVQININRPPSIQEIIQEAIRSGACEQILELDDKRRTIESNQVSGNICHECQSREMGHGESPETDRSYDHADAQGPTIAADPDRRSTASTRQV